MLPCELHIESLKLSIRNPEQSVMFKTGLKYFKDNFYFPVKKPRASRAEVLICEFRSEDKIGLADWLCNFLIHIGALPEGAAPIYTDEYLLTCLDLVRSNLRSRFNVLYIYVLTNIHRIAADMQTMTFTIVHLSMFFSPDFLNRKLEEFNNLNTVNKNSSESHDIHVTYLRSLLSECLAAADI